MGKGGFGGVENARSWFCVEGGVVKLEVPFKSPFVLHEVPDNGGRCCGG